MSTSEGSGGIRMSIFRPLMTFNRRPEDIRSWHETDVRPVQRMSVDGVLNGLGADVV